MSFLLTSPLINEVAILLLMSLLGWKFTLLYVVIGMTVGILGGWFLDAIKAERWLQSFAAKALADGQKKNVASDSTTHSTISNSISGSQESPKLSFAERHEFAKEMSTPAVVIDEQLVHSGSMPHTDQIIKWLSK